jgi:hypothetical protein
MFPFGQTRIMTVIFALQNIPNTEKQVPGSFSMINTARISIANVRQTHYITTCALQKMNKFPRHFNIFGLIS